ncbi:MAG TPA: alkaline phosphatase [Thermoanaerobaculia bacterium]|nr:alkaline phosphatase [Thermoanaerobaculia bacterium]
MKLATLALLTLVVCLPLEAQAPENIILFIGDGIGPAHFTATRIVRDKDFQIGRMPVVGLVTTRSASSAVTDSAAAATALATGVKTTNEFVGMDPAGKSHQTVLEAAELAGKSTGMVTTSEFWDATLGAFGAHAKDRHDFWLEIAQQMLATGTEFVIGGGGEPFGKGKVPTLESVAGAAKFTLVRSLAALQTSSAPHILAVFPTQPRHLDFPEAPLPVLTKWAIDRLEGAPDGFFLLIEHEGTDSASHQNNWPDVRASLISLDQSVGIALDFAMSRSDTLVLVTGDHETGALRISETRLGRPRLEWATTVHTGVAVPIFGYGPGSSQFGGLMDNTEVGKRLLSFVSSP